MAPEYVVPYFVSNGISLTLLAFAFWRPQVTRWGLAAIFAYAAIFNPYIGLTKPEQYQGFASLALLKSYRAFIEGFFRDHATILLCLIGLGQGIIAVSMAIAGRWLWIGVLGCCVFLTAIIPLGVGSAFPFSLIASAAAIVMFRKLART